MGLFDSVGKEVRREFIARPDEAKDYIIWKHPDSNIRKWTQLTIQPDEVAVFFRDGQVMGTLGNGRHTLDASNIPFLGRLVDAASGGNLFITEIFFVTIREFANLPFGGPIGDLSDPDTKLAVGIRVFGDYSLHVIDPQQLMLGLVGVRRLDSNDKLTSWFKELLLKTIRDISAEHIVKKKMPLLELTSGAYTEEIEVETIQNVKTHAAPYGVEIVRLGNFVISMKEEDEATLKTYRKDKVYTEMAGGFQAYAAGEAMLGAGEGMKKGGGPGGGESAMLGGAGIGVGFGMAGMMMQQAQAGQAKGPQPPAAPTAVPPDTDTPTAVAVICPACSKQVPPGKFCAECGKTLPQQIFCAQCGAKVPPEAKFCGGCGKPV
jgi:membrane protease subunit (stomatin/prohibitin family)